MEDTNTPVESTEEEVASEVETTDQEAVETPAEVETVEESVE